VINGKPAVKRLEINTLDAGINRAEACHVDTARTTNNREYSAVTRGQQIKNWRQTVPKYWKSLSFTKSEHEFSDMKCHQDSGGSLTWSIFNEDLKQKPELHKLIINYIIICKYILTIKL